MARRTQEELAAKAAGSWPCVAGLLLSCKWQLQRYGEDACPCQARIAVYNQPDDVVMWQRDIRELLRARYHWHTRWSDGGMGNNLKGAELPF